jgi:hypothetical protein
MGEPWKLCKPKLEEVIVQGIIPGDWDPATVHSFRGIYSIINPTPKKKAETPKATTRSKTQPPTAPLPTDGEY